MRGSHLFLCVSALLWNGGCTDDATSIVGGPSGMLDGGSGCADDEMQSCDCASGGSGTQVCVDGDWGACKCAGSGSLPSGTPSGSTGTSPSANMDPGRSEAGDFCQAGYYTGTIDGEYWTGAFDFGFGALVPADIVGKASGGGPALAITIRDDPGEDRSKDVFVISDGCVQGVADAGGTEHPFFAKMTGELNCQTGELQAVLSGYYYLYGFPQATYSFKGPVTGNYQPGKQGFPDGNWDVKEHEMTANPPGGMGTWNATWTDEVEAAPGLPPECTALLEGTGPEEAEVVVAF